MTLTILNVIYVLIATAMIGFILVQRGAGAQAGSGFGAGASATVFGARGAGNFLTRSTAVLATVFFLLSLGMGMYVTHGGLAGTPADIGVMDAVDEAPAAPATPSEIPALPADAAPAATAPAAADVPAPAADPAADATAPAVEVEGEKDDAEDAPTQ